MSKAYPHDPNLAYPWRAWAELVDFAGIDDPMAAQVRSRARPRRTRRRSATGGRPSHPS